MNGLGLLAGFFFVVAVVAVIVAGSLTTRMVEELNRRLPRDKQVDPDWWHPVNHDEFFAAYRAEFGKDRRWRRRRYAIVAMISGIAATIILLIARSR